MLFDTLELSKALQRSFTPEQAETLVQALGRASSDQLATKADIVDVKSEIASVRAELVTFKAELARFKTEVAGEFASVRSEIKALEASLTSMVVAQISLLRAETIKWIVTAIVFNSIGIVGLVVTLSKVFGK